MLQKYFKKKQTLKKIKPKKIVEKNICFISKLYKGNKITNLNYGAKIQNMFELSLSQDESSFSKPINNVLYITKSIKKIHKIKRFYKFPNNNSFKTIVKN